MADSVTRWTIEHSEKERLVQLEVTDMKAKIKHIEHLIKEKHPQWHIISKCVQLKERVDSFETLSKDLTCKSNEINTSLQLTLHDPKTDDTKKARCQQLSDILLTTVTKQSELDIMIAELTCAFIARLPDTSSTPSDTTAAPTLPQTNSTIFGSFDYLKPLPLASDCSSDQLEVFKQGFKTWFGMVCGGPEHINREKSLMFASLIRSLDTDWQTYVRQKPDIETLTMEQIF